MDENKSLNESHSNGRFVDSPGHSPDFSENSDVEIEVIGSGNEDKKDAPAERQGRAFKFKEIEAEREIVESIISSFGMILPLKKEEVKEKNGDGSEETQEGELSSEELEQKFVALIQQLETNYIIIKELSENIVPDRIKELNDLEIESEDDLKIIITRVLAPLTNLVDLVNNGVAGMTEVEALSARYKSKFLAENGFASENALGEAVSDRRFEFHEAKDSLIAKVFKRGEIHEKRINYESLQAIMDHLREHDRMLSNESLKYRYINSFDRLVSSAWEKAIEKIKLRFDQHTGIDSSKVESSYGYYSSAERGEQETVFNDEALERLQEEYIQSIAIPSIREAEQYWDETFSEKDVEKGLSLLRESFSIDFRSSFSMVDKEKEKKRQECLSAVQELKPHHLSDAISNLMEMRNGGSANNRFQSIGRLVRDTIPQHEEVNVLSDQYLRIFELIDNLSESRWGVGFITGIYERRIFLERRGIEDEDRLENFINNLDMKLWEMLSESDIFRDGVGEENLEAAKEFVRKKVFGNLLKNKQGTEESVEMGYKLLNFKSPEAIIINILNAFRETGRHTPRPFLDDGFKDPRNTKIFKYLESLTEEQLQRAFDLGIPEIKEIVDLIRENSDVFCREMLYDTDNYKSSENPVYKLIHEKLLIVAQKFIDLGGSDRKAFAITLVGSLKCEIGEFESLIEKALESSEDIDVRSAALDTILRRMGDDMSMIKIYLDNQDSIRNLEEIQEMERKSLNINGEVVSDQKSASTIIHGYLVGWKKLIQILDQSQEGVDNEYLNKLLALGYELFIANESGKDTEGEESNIEESSRMEEFQIAMMKIINSSKNLGEYSANFLLNTGVGEYLAKHSNKVDKVITIAESGVFIADVFVSLCIDRIESIVQMSDDEINSLGSKVAANEKYFRDYSTASEVVEHPDRIDVIVFLADNGFFEENTLKNLCLNHLEQIMEISQEKILIYLKVLKQIDQSPSQEIQRLKNQLLVQILDAEDPEKAYSIIEDIFVKNNIPTVGKIYKIFEELNPREVLGKRIDSNSSISPFLRDAGSTRRSFTIYNDLLRCHIDSGNRSLKKYLEILQSGESIMEKIAENGIDSLEGSDLEQATFFLSKLRTLLNNTRSGRVGNITDGGKINNVGAEYADLCESLNVRDGQTVNERIVEMFLKPLGLETIDEVLKRMKAAKRTAHERGIAMAQQARDGRLSFRDGDLLKGINDKFLNLIMQNGNVAKEFLGADSDSDATPLDTDVSRVEEGGAANGFSSVVNESLAKNYGQMIFVIRDRGQFQMTDSDTTEFEPEKLELFQTGALGSKHFGIRTGFPMTEVDFIVIQDNLKRNNQELEKIYFEIAKNGYYIPVTDERGNIIFTPEMFDEYFEMFEGLELFDGPELDIITTLEGDQFFEQIGELKEVIRKDQEKISEIAQRIREVISGVLVEYGIELKSVFDTSLLGAELHDTGSTGRHTNAPKDYDFDLVLRLDDSELKNSQQILERIKEKLQPERIEEYSKESGHSQLRAFGCKGISEESVDVDIGIVKKSELAVFGSHDAVSAKLEWIRENHGNEAYDDVVANIVLAKQILKEGAAYKKMDHGGMGGIGVENWILLNGGNIMEAFRTFFEAAHDENGSRLSLYEFRKRYKVLDPGMNVQKMRHDNFIDVLKPNGYTNMLDVIEKYLLTNNE